MAQGRNVATRAGFTSDRHRQGEGTQADPTAHELMDAAGRLRRSVRRIVRRGWPYRPLLESELELLRLVARRPGCRVGEAAEALGLAENTVSTLVGTLVRRGLVDRRRDEQDARAAALFPSEAATRRMAAWRDRRAEVVGKALSSLPVEDRIAIDAALPALRRLVQELEQR